MAGGSHDAGALARREAEKLDIASHLEVDFLPKWKNWSDAKHSRKKHLQALLKKSRSNN